MSFLAEGIARETFAEAEPLLRLRPAPTRPVVVVFVGVPFAGKSTLARAVVAAAARSTLYVENDALRARVVRALGREAALYDGRENFVTYRAAWDLLALALSSGANAVHDATNLDEGGRRGAYAAADAAGADACVVFVEAAEATRAARALVAPPEREAAHAKLGRRRPDPAKASRPALVLSGEDDVASNVRRLAAWEPAHALALPTP